MRVAGQTPLRLFTLLVTVALLVVIHFSFEDGTLSNAAVDKWNGGKL